MSRAIQPYLSEVTRMIDPLRALLVAGLVAAVGAMLFWLQKSLYPRWRQAFQMSARVLSEDALKHIHNYEMEGRSPTLQSVAGALNITANRTAEMLARLEASNLVDTRGGEFHLTPSGRDYALRVIRAHRLWERHLADETGYTESDWHQRAERYEHRLSPAEADNLSRQLGHPTHDPHGDPIPTAHGEVVPHGGKPLTSARIDQPMRIVHIEDEPPAIYAQLVAQGLYPGMTVRLTEVSSQRVRFWARGDEHVLAPIFAASIAVAPLPQESHAENRNGEQLSVLKPGEKCVVVHISHRCRGPERRRLLDLGILPGTMIVAELVSPSKDPTAYRIRDALIALRKEQAQLIDVVRLPEDAGEASRNQHGDERLEMTQ